MITERGPKKAKPKGKEAGPVAPNQKPMPAFLNKKTPKAKAKI